MPSPTIPPAFYHDFLSCTSEHDHHNHFNNTCLMIKTWMLRHQRVNYYNFMLSCYPSCTFSYQKQVSGTLDTFSSFIPTPSSSMWLIYLSSGASLPPCGAARQNRFACP
jgi:hypothetical protein